MEMLSSCLTWIKSMSSSSVSLWLSLETVRLARGWLAVPVQLSRENPPTTSMERPRGTETRRQSNNLQKHQYNTLAYLTDL